MKCHPIEQSPFFKMGSPQRLAKVLGVDLNRLEEMANRPAVENYNLFSITRNDKKRLVQEPKVHVQRLNLRVCDLLTRIEPPKYLHSAIKRREVVQENWTGPPLLVSGWVKQMGSGSSPARIALSAADQGQIFR